MRVAIDTGGTFTDLVADVPGRGRVRLKVPSTPDDPAQAVLAAIELLAEHVTEVRHGTTVATNAILERRTAHVALITNEGFEDLLILRRQARPDLYALHPVVSPPLTRDVVPVRVRRSASGESLDPLPNLQKWLETHRVRLESADAFAVCLLHADLFGADEQAIGDVLRAAFPKKPTTLSHVLSPVFREYERAATAVLNAAVTPIMAGYLRRLELAAGATLLVMASGGGLIPSAMAAETPAHTVLSGPAGGVQGAWAVAQRNEVEAILTVDMGGTSTDVSVVSGDLRPVDDGDLHGHPLRVPLLPIETVGAGGGSVAFLDAGGLLRVGPRSAGALPGPVCYGRGGVEPTVTDAHAVLGRLTHLLGGDFGLDVQAAHASIEMLASRLGLSATEVAQQIVDIAEANMARACKQVSLARGVDPRGLTLVPFGGAGGLHACGLADALGCARVLLPVEPGVLSAEGILSAPRETSRSASVYQCLDELGADSLRVISETLESGARRESTEGRSPANVSGRWRTVADLRYQGQTFTLAVDEAERTPDELSEAFSRAHDERFGYRMARPVEVITVRGRLTLDAVVDRTDVVFERQVISGPRSIQTYGSTSWLPEGWRAQRTPSGDWSCERRVPPTPNVDLALEVHRQQLASVADEMGQTLMQAAFSANIKERRDYSCAVFDASGQMLVHAAHIPVHLGATPASVRAAIDSGLMIDGSSVVLNDPFSGGTHLPDVTLVTPVLVYGSIAYYVANRAHHADVGGIVPGSLPAPRDADGAPRPLTLADEGICLPPSRLDDALRERFAQASRLPDDRRGDLRAQEAANRHGATRLQDLVTSESSHRDAALLNYSERRIRALIRGLPDGVYLYTDQLDDDGLDSSPVVIPVTLRIDGDALKVDFRDAPPQSRGPLNAVRAIVDSAVFYCLRCLGGADIPANAGMLRPVEILTTPGTLVDARPPAAVSAGNVETSQRLVDVIFGALAQADPRVPAASCGSMNNVLFGGEGPNGPFVHYETLAGGAGAGAEGPGADAVHTHMTNTLNTPIEALERAFPVRIERYALAANDSTGGRGVIRRYRFLADATVTLVTERRTTSPPGRNGAADGPRGRNVLIRDGEVIELRGKDTVNVRAGDAIEITTPGGAGYKRRQSIGTSAAPKE